VRVDYETQERTVKASGRWYGQVARANAVPERSATVLTRPSDINGGDTNGGSDPNGEERAVPQA
jgi:beta-glucosidase